jgi:hypothetical protein
MGRGGHAGGLVCPMYGALPFAPFAERGKVRDPPSAPYCTLTPRLRPAPCLCTNGVRAGVTQGQGRRPFYAPPLRSPCRFRGRGKVCDPSLPRPLLHADAPLCALPPVRARTRFAPESRRGRAAALLPSPVQPPPFAGAQEGT